MRCTSPRKVSFTREGEITFSPRQFSKEFEPFQLPCSKCIECRLDYARQWAIRCVHEAKMHSENSFITLTYSDEHLRSAKLIYEDFQLFMKKLRKTQNDPIGIFVTGEYGEKTKRPHWHALLFGWRPKDQVLIRTNHRGDEIYSSGTLSRLWNKGMCELGSVTIESAGYCARYAAKKLVHGRDDEHEFRPISKKSSKHAIGKSWLEKNFPDVFTHGKLVLRTPDGGTTVAAIPRYYERWFRDNHPDLWVHYVTHVKAAICKKGQERSEKEEQDWINEMNRRRDLGRKNPLTANQVREIISEQKFKNLQAHLKL